MTPLSPRRRHGVVFALTAGFVLPTASGCALKVGVAFDEAPGLQAGDPVSYKGVEEFAKLFK